MKINTGLFIRIFPIACLTMLVLPGSGQAQDTTPPNITAFSFSPGAINTSTSSANVTVNFTLTDVGTGVFYLETGFVAPSGGPYQSTFKIFSPPRTSTTDSATITFPRFSPEGTWNVAYIF